MRILESRIERKCCKIAAERGIPNVKLGQNGYPDRVFLVPGGRPFMVEFKALDGKPSRRQEAIIRGLRAIGYRVYVCDSVEVFIKVLEHETEDTTSEMGPA